MNRVSVAQPHARQGMPRNGHSGAASRSAAIQAEDVTLALERALAACWLLDAMESGALSFLSRTAEQDDGSEAAGVPWWSGPPTCPLDAQTLKGWLARLALEALATALSEAYGDAVDVSSKIRDAAPKEVPA